MDPLFTRGARSLGVNARVRVADLLNPGCSALRGYEFDFHLPPKPRTEVETSVRKHGKIRAYSSPPRFRRGWELHCNLHPRCYRHFQLPSAVTARTEVEMQLPSALKPRREVDKSMRKHSKNRASSCPPRFQRGSYLHFNLRPRSYRGGELKKAVNPRRRILLRGSTAVFNSPPR